MIRMIQSRSAFHAKAYFDDALQKSDYYLDDQELQGKIGGRLALRIGLSGSVTKDIFYALCENRNPLTNGGLTARTDADRTVGYDINFHCPKSVSVLHALSKDDHILKAFEDAVQQTMQDIERDSKTRVRLNGKYEDRETDELLWTSFTHQTARPVDGSLPDPHLHCHVYTFNATWDDEEQRIKAGQFRDIQRDMPFYQAAFHKRLADKMMELGYQIEPTKNAFEIKGVPQKVINLLSKRTNEIGRVAKEKNITNAKELSELGAKTRSSKQKGHTMLELKTDWRKQVHELEAKEGKTENQTIRFAPIKEKSELTPQQCIDYTLAHSFERASVVQDRRLLATAYRHAIGNRDVSVDAINWCFQSDNRIINIQENGKTMSTTKVVLAEEKRMVALALAGQGKMRPLYLETPDIKLDGQQKEAINHILTTTNQVSIISGKAGTGKSTLIKEAVEWIESTGKKVTLVAPTAQASREVLRSEGFEQADTIAKLLKDKKMQESLANQVLWVDEAGLLGTKDMTTILELATKQNARLILGGDTKQHSSVVRGDAVRILNTVGGIKAAEVSKIYRQRNEHYKDIVENLSKGDVKTAFDKLDKSNAIQTIDPLNPHETIVNDYIEVIKNKKTALVVSPTHEQGDQVTNAIRAKLKEIGLIGKKDVSATRLNNLNLTEAQKSDWRNFKEGHVIQFNQNLPDIKRGSVWTVEKSASIGVFIQNEKKEIQFLPLEKSSQYDVFQKSQINLSKGDTIRITRNGFDTKNKKLVNGQLMEVASVSRFGKVKLRSKVSDVTYKVRRDHGHLAHAYCVTSHASQGKTVDEVLIAQPTATFAATDAKQFYVSVSRGRDRVRIYTDDKAQLLEYASQMGDRQSAMELVGKKDQTKQLIEDNIRKNLIRDDLTKSINPKTKEIEKAKPKKDKSYEPTL